MGKSTWEQFEAAKQELIRRNLPPEEFEREIRRLCRKLKL